MKTDGRRRAGRLSAARMEIIVQRLNIIGDNPLLRHEAHELRRAYLAAVVRYFDTRNSERGI
jgi:hypothetical protein